MRTSSAARSVTLTVLPSIRPKYGDLLQVAVRRAAEFHDLGKLDDVNQEVLRTNSGKMLNHVDAGVAHLLDGSLYTIETCCGNRRSCASHRAAGDGCRKPAGTRP